MQAYECRTSGVPLAYIQRVPRVCLSYRLYVRIRTKFLSMLKKNVLPCRMRALRCIYNVAIAYVNVYRRMNDIFHTLAYASTIRNSVTGP
jgi:hypothetical protein